MSPLPPVTSPLPHLFHPPEASPTRGIFHFLPLSPFVPCSELTAFPRLRQAARRPLRIPRGSGCARPTPSQVRALGEEEEEAVRPEEDGGREPGAAGAVDVGAPLSPPSSPFLCDTFLMMPSPQALLTTSTPRRQSRSGDPHPPAREPSPPSSLPLCCPQAFSPPPLLLMFRVRASGFG